ncbi:MAG: hypothetical protein B9S32_00370 [Verrucomicrobia bacterium Tous-C9LFEB]|nr:MAG: hypothetical protein B9S32_00370 [Verrucomicrobia bacterium Tous-C9LFEB]
MSIKKGNLPTGFHPWRGVFETLRVKNGRAEFVEEHWKNLRTAAKALGLKVSGDLRETGQELPRQSGRLRWVVETDQSYVMFHPESLTVKATYSLALAPQRVGSENWDARYKTLSYLTHWQARQSVKADEALLLNEYGEIASGAMSNVFWVTDGKVYTPSDEAGCREGVVRAWVLGQLKVQEGLFDLRDLEEADEVFLTNSWIGIRPVGQLGRHKIKTGPITRKLQQRFAKAQA